MKNYDAVVVGAGPAGSTAAYILSKKGYRVLLLDKEKFPRRKLCGGALTGKTIRLLDNIFAESPASLSKNKIIDSNSNHFEIRYKSDVLIKKDSAHTFYFIDRFIYDDFLLHKAREAGADTAVGEKITAIANEQPVIHSPGLAGKRPGGEGMNELVTAGGRTIGAKFIIAADGANSTLRSQLVRENKIAASGWRRGLAYALEVSIEREEKFSAITYPILSFGYIRYGYAWIFPNRERLIAGMGGLERKNGTDLSDRFRTFLADFGISTGKKLRGHPLPFGNFLTKPVWGNILLVGDAAGLVDPMLGEGIYQAHKSGELAARAIIEKIENNKNIEDNYISLLKTHLMPEFIFARRARWFVYNRLNHFLKYRSARWVESSFDKLEQLIHGRRTYKWFKKKNL
ncbi:MAG: geranylgeranyl reductase family protein [Candidatus Aminicenantes bacterium]|nr:geranylgeranyl reductase family protein [Candidatus Aminicenantes bacterium]